MASGRYVGVEPRLDVLDKKLNELKEKLTPLKRSWTDGEV